MKKVLAMLMAALMVAAMFAGCSSSKPATETTAAAADASDAAGSVKIGMSGPLTGGAAIYGNAVKNGAQIAVDEINAKGGVQFLSCATKTIRTTPKRPSTRTTR